MTSAAPTAPSAPQPPRSLLAERSFGDWLRIGFFYKRAFLLWLLLPVVAAVALTFFMRTTYEVEARVLVRIGREYTAMSETGGVGKDLTVDPSKVVQTETDILSSQAVRLDVLQSIGPLTIYPDLARTPPEPPEATLDRAMQLLGRQVRIENQPGSFVFRIAFSHTNPVIAAAVVEGVVKAYVEQRRQVFFQIQSTFLANVRDQIKSQLDETESAIDKIRTRNGVFDINAQRIALIDRQQEQAQLLRQLEARRQGLDAEAATAGIELKSLPQEIVAGTDRVRQQGWDQLRQRLSDAEVDRARLASLFGPNSSGTTILDRQIALLRQQLSGSPAIVSDTQRRTPNPQHQALMAERAKLDRDIAAATAQLKEMSTQSKSIDGSLSSLSQSEMELAPLIRRRSVIEQIYLDYARRTDEATVQENADLNRSANVRIVQPARIPSRGRSMRANVLAAGAALGLLLAPAMVFVLASAQRRIMMPTDAVRALGRPNLGSTWLLGWRQRRRRRSGTPEPAALAARMNEILPIVHAMRAGQGRDGTPPHIIMFASLPDDAAHAHDLVRDAATSLAIEEARPVLLIDTPSNVHADHFTAQSLLGEPVVETFITGRDGERRDQTSLAVAGGRTQILRARRIVGAPLYVARTDDAMPLLANLLDGRESIADDELVRRYAQIIIDGGALSGDFRMLRASAAADATIVAIAADEIGETEAGRLRDRIHSIGGFVMGSVLLDRRRHLPAFLDRLL